MVEEPLLELLRQLRALDYEFVAVTPATHARVVVRQTRMRPSLRDIFGWNRSFAPHDLGPKLLSLLEAADALERSEGELRSRVRVASLDRDLFLHSSYPTDSVKSVFFGPDTYRFARFIKQQLPLLHPPAWIVDMGAGSGAGGIVAAQWTKATRLTLVDINDEALKLARVNAAMAGVQVEAVTGAMMPAGANLVIANPPYIMDASKRVYRDGGEVCGGAVALNWARQALEFLAPGGTMLLYTGAAYESGRAPLLDALERECAEQGGTVVIEELDPDVFGEELDGPAYSCVERIGLIGAVLTKASA